MPVPVGVIASAKHNASGGGGAASVLAAADLNGASGTVTIPAGATLALVTIACASNAAATAVTVGGVACTPVVQGTPTGSTTQRLAEIWALAAPPTGAQAVAVTSAASRVEVAVVSLDATSADGGAANASTGNVSSIAVTPTEAAGADDLHVAVFAARATVSPTSPDTTVAAGGDGSGIGVAWTVASRLGPSAADMTATLTTYAAAAVCRVLA